MAGAQVYRPHRLGSGRIVAGAARAVLPAGAKAGGSLVSGWEKIQSLSESSVREVG
jgi:hypothetical protein